MHTDLSTYQAEDDYHCHQEIHICPTKQQMNLIPYA